MFSPCLDFGLLEGFDAACHARHITLSRWLYCLDKGFGEALGMDAAPEAMRPQKSRIREETNTGAEPMSRGGSFRSLSFSCQNGVRERERGA